MKWMSGNPVRMTAFAAFLILFAFSPGCRGGKAPDPDRDMASEDMLSDADRQRLQAVAEPSAESGEEVRRLLESPDLFLRMMTLTRLQRWPREQALDFFLGTAKTDKSSMVRKKALGQAWTGITNLDREMERFDDLISTTVSCLEDPDDGVFDAAVNSLREIEDTGHLLQVRYIIEKAAGERKPKLFSLYCKKNLTTEDVSFVMENETVLGESAAICRARVAYARQVKFVYDD